MYSGKEITGLGPESEDLFQVVKEELVKPSILALYNPVAPTNILADALLFWLRCCHLSKDVTTDTWNP